MFFAIALGRDGDTDNVMTSVPLMAQFMPHGHCYLWTPSLVWLNVLADTFTALAYFSIPLTLISFFRRRGRDFPFNGTLLAFAIFILACGATHVMEIWNIWHSDYWLAGAIKVVTAVASIITAIYIIRLQPQLLALPGARELTDLNAALERRVAERTQELAQANAELRRREERRELVVRGNNEGVWEWDCVRDEILFSDKVYEIFRAKPTGRVESTRTAFDLFQPLDRPAMREVMRAHAEEGAPFVIEQQFRRRDGSLVWVRIRGESSRDAGGKVVRMAGSFSDIDAARRAEENLRFQSQVLAQVSDAVFATDLEQCVTYWNRAAERLYGVPASEMIGQSISVAYERVWRQPEDAQGMWDALASTGYWQGELIHGLRDGRRVFVESTVNTIKDPAGTVVGYLAVVRNVTKQLELEAQMRSSQKLEAIGLLAGGIAHDFNNLLQVINGYTAFSLESAVPWPERKANLEQVRAAGQRAAQLTAQLLAFSRRQSLRKDDLDLNQALADLLKMIRRLIGEQIQVDFIAGHNLGNVRADRAQLDQVLLNLCINARDAMPNGGRLTLETENVLVNGAFRESHPWAKPGRYVLISVSDNGGGMDKETQLRIFEPFFTTKARGEGTGLGLSVVDGVIKQHGGMVHVYSEPGLGSTFKIYLPITERAADTAGSKLPVAPARGTETILVAEDEPQVRLLAVRILERAGYRVFAAADGEEASAIFVEHCAEIALLVLDVVMPRMGGLEVRERAHRLRADVPVILCSGYAGPGLTQGDGGSPSQRLLQKPYGADELLARVRQALDTKTTGSS